MAFAFRLADEGTVRAFLEWRYEPPYDIYNPDPETLEEEVQYFLDPQVTCYGMWNEQGELAAYCTFGQDGQVPGGDYGEEGLDIGLGVRPDLTGQGQGIGYVEAVVDFAWRSFAPRALRVTVAEFNARAQRVWKKAGFRKVQRFERDPDGLPFVVLTRGR
jgi:ribosomal-protein-alanine N-acetyltransferase